MQTPDCPLVDASPDAHDEEGFDAVIRVWKQAEAEAEVEADSPNVRRKLRKQKAEVRFLHEEETLSANTRAKHAARAYERVVSREHEDEPDFFDWNSNRALDKQDFDYLFFHRQRSTKKIRTWLEIIASKIVHINEDGEPGYFNKLERNIGWTDYIAPLLFTGAEITDKLVRCGLWVHSHNSRRCHKPDFCPLCLWNDILKVLAEAFGSGSGTFYGASAWWFITISWTTNPRNAKCVSGDYDPEDNKPPKGDRGYDPYPVVLGSDDYDSDMGWVGYQDARVLGLMMQEAVSDLYHQHIDGYHHKLEGVYRLHPGGANRVNLHCHTVANGREQDGDFIAQVLRQSITGKLSRCKDRLNRRYHVDLQVKAITTPEHLEHAVVYSEKVVPIRHMVADAMSRPEAKLPDGSWSPGYVDGLQTSLIHLIEDDIPNIFNGARLEPELPSLFRRKTVGNMVFTDKGTCIGDEPDWHKLARRRHAKKQREQRREKQKKRKEEEAKLRKQGKPVPAPKWYLRRRKHSRRLSRSLERSLRGSA